MATTWHNIILGGKKGSFLIFREKLYSDRDEIKVDILKLMDMEKIFAKDTSDKNIYHPNQRIYKTQQQENNLIF